jgi:hypothetical protein
VRSLSSIRFKKHTDLHCVKSHENMVKTERSQHNVVGIVTTLRAGWAGVRIPTRARDLLVSKNHPDRRWGPASVLFNTYRGSFPRIKRPGREVGCFPPSSVGS